MKITRVTPYLFRPGEHKHWLFIKVETDEGITGWGESYTHLDRDRNVMQFVEELERYVVGRDPFNIKSFTYFAYVDFAKKRGSLDFFSAVSGLEMAMWDIVGKALNSPVYRLLGGACKEKLRVYVNNWEIGAKDLGDLRERAIGAVEKGFSALKLDPMPDNWSMFLTKEDIKYTVDRVRAVREAVGPDVDLLMDAHRRMAPYDALNLADKLEEFNLFWYEEPVSARNMEMLAGVKARLKTRVVTGEELYTKAEFRRVFELGAADVINLDPQACGGMLELKEIAAMAETYYVSVAPHNSNLSYLAMSATSNICVTMPNHLISECFLEFEEARLNLVKEPLVIKDGYLYVSDRPGLGIEMNEEYLLKHPYQKAKKRVLHEVL